VLNLAADFQTGPTNRRHEPKKIFLPRTTG
jgi:hypothetical protein